MPRTLPRPVQHLHYQKQQAKATHFVTHALLLCGAGGLLCLFRQSTTNTGTEKDAGCCFSVDETRTERSAWPRVVFSLFSARYFSLNYVKGNAANWYMKTWVRTKYFLYSRVSQLSFRLSHAQTLDLVFSCLHGIVCHVRPASLSLSPSFFLSLSFYSLPSCAVPLPRAACKRAFSHSSRLDRSVDMNFPIANFNVNTMTIMMTMSMTVIVSLRNDYDAACQPISRLHWRVVPIFSLFV